MENLLPSILIVDDDEFVLLVLARALQQLGYRQVSVDAHSTRAIDRLRQGELPDILLLDLNMPELDGIEFLRSLVPLNFTGHIILISGEDERILQTANNLARSHRLNILGHIRKPPQPGELSDLLGYWQPGKAISPTNPNRPANPPISRECLLRALEQGEFVNFYQPKIAACNRRLHGVETLVRWRHPQSGLIAPDRFIPLIEAYELIDALTWSVLEQALQQMKRWENAGYPLEVAVNVSMDNLKNLDFPDRLMDMVRAAGVLPEKLTLEVTESQLAKDKTLPMDILTRLRLKRISLSIDDFGTGYSSLAQLMELPFTELKIDRSFVQSAENDERALIILKSSMEMAQKLNMRVVAEGVETEAQYRLIASLGCNLVQGYLFARPMPADELMGWAEG